MDGWISIHRKILSWEWYTDSNMVHLALHLLLKANHAPRHWKGIALSRGQLLSGRRQISAETGMPEQTIRTCLLRLSKSNFLMIKSTQKFTIITITKYDDYQLLPQPGQPTEQPTANQQLTNYQPTTNQQLTTNNKYNKENNDNKYNKEEEESENSKKNDFKKIESAFAEFCPALPQIKSMHENRKKAIRSIIKKEGLQKLIEAFRLAGQSDFLTGQNDRSWTADFDWILKPQNFYKILEGKYTNPTKHEKFKPNDPRASQSEGWGIPL
jgi:hypothetical protein